MWMDKNMEEKKKRKHFLGAYWLFIYLFLEFLLFKMSFFYYYGKIVVIIVVIIGALRINFF